MTMAKRNPDDNEISLIREHLDRQDKTMNEILTVIRGSVAMGVDGIIAKQKEAEEAIEKLISDVAHLHRWKKIMQENKGKFTVSVADVLKTVFSIIGLSGTLIGLFLGLKELFDKSM